MRPSGRAVRPAMRTLVLPALIIGFSVVVIWASLQLNVSPPMIVGESMQPRVFPIVLMIINMGLAVALALQYRIAPPKQIRLEGIPTWGTIALFGVFFVLTVYVDMIIAIAATVFLMCLLWGERRLPVALAVSVIAPATVFLLFDKVLQIRFPRGLFTNWYYG